jgi:hypothetical protein
MYRRKIRHEERGYLRICALLLKCMSIEPYSRYVSRAAAGLPLESAKRSHPQSDAIAAADGKGSIFALPSLYQNHLWSITHNVQKKPSTPDLFFSTESPTENCTLTGLLHSHL